MNETFVKTNSVFAFLYIAKVVGDRWSKRGETASFARRYPKANFSTLLLHFIGELDRVDKITHTKDFRSYSDTDKLKVS